MNARTAKLIHRYCLTVGDPFRIKRNARNERRKWNALTPRQRAEFRVKMLELVE
jgi:hypothetical protein